MSALSGKTQTSKKINRIELRLTVNDINNPLHNIIFLNLNKKELIYDEKSKNEALQLVRRWYGIIEVVIKQANDKKEIGSLANELKIAPKLAIVSIADEIKKLADLHSAGILTLEEFQQQKTKLLGKQ
ncbi:MAG: SHOCT domain-containing protein [Methylococcaceae bacterium]|nr:SHOCT domain-containing protein [Methylococcaceae bacterium]